MKRLALIPLLILAAAVPSLAANTDPADDFVATGTITAGNPGTKKLGGIAEIGSPCMGSIDPDVPAGTFNGLDGAWVALGENWSGAEAKLTAAPLDAVALTLNDVDAWFYDDACALIGPSVDHAAYHMATSGLTEYGVIPTGAAWVAIDLADGAAAEYTFTVYDVVAPR
jgi:hypothetical protein